MHCCPNCGSNLSALEPVEFGNVAIDEDGTIILDGRRVRLTRTLYRVAESIIRARGRGVTRDILAARLDGEVTIKRLQRQGGTYRLLPRNPAYAPIDVQPEQDFFIEGVFCGLLRRD